jgi:hypothetical protein
MQKSALGRFYIIAHIGILGGYRLIQMLAPLADTD